MKCETKLFPSEVGPYGDLHSRNIVLQEMDGEHARIDFEHRREEVSLRLYLLANPDKLNDPVFQRLHAPLNRQFEPSSQAINSDITEIETEQKRMETYKSLQVSTDVLKGEDAEIEENPFKYLYLSPDATLAQARNAWITLARSWHPDLMDPENKQQNERIFGKSKITTGMSQQEIAETLPPTKLKADQIEKLSPQDQKEYHEKIGVWDSKVAEYKKIQQEMQLHATQKMQIINKAFQAIKKRFSNSVTESFAGFNWEPVAYHFLDTPFFMYDVLPLEGEGELQKGRDQTVSLAFDRGNIFYSDHYGCRQFVDLRAFFAWTELRRGQDLCPTLLDDLRRTYKFDITQTEQLRQMMANHERPEFILATLHIPFNENDYSPLLDFLDTAYDGPTYCRWSGKDFAEEYSLGVVFTPDDRLNLTYESQQFQGSGKRGRKQEAQFSQEDLKMMQSIAYGPLLPG